MPPRPRPVPVDRPAGRPPPAADGPPESIGALLVHLRLARGWSQLRLAEHLCAAAGVATVSRHEVSRWEREERVPGRFWLGWLAAALDVPVGRLLAARPAGRGGGARRRGLARGDVPVRRGRGAGPTGGREASVMA